VDRVISPCSCAAVLAIAVFTFANVFQLSLVSDIQNSHILMSCLSPLHSIIIIVIIIVVILLLSPKTVSQNYLTDLLLTISWNVVLPAKLAVSQLFKKFLPFYGNQMFITSLTSTHHLFLSSTRSFQSMPSITLLGDTS
jgi:hypothetical protein